MKQQHFGNRSPVILIALLALLSINGAMADSANWIWMTNAECLGPPTYTETFPLENAHSHCSAVTSNLAASNGTYLQHVGTLECDPAGENAYLVFQNAQCSGAANLTRTFFAACSPFAPDSVNCPPSASSKRQIARKRAESAGQPSQAFNCLGVPGFRPYVQLRGPGCNTSTADQSTVLTWSNIPALCVRVYNTSAAGNVSSSAPQLWTMNAEACQSDAQNFTAVFFSDGNCTTSAGNLTFTLGCTSRWNATCVPPPAPIPLAPITPTPSVTPPTAPTPITPTPSVTPPAPTPVPVIVPLAPIAPVPAPVIITPTVVIPSPANTASGPVSFSLFALAISIASFLIAL